MKFKLPAHLRAYNPDLDAVTAVLAGTSKYGNQRVTVDGVTLDSKAEARRYQELKTLERAGAIWGLLVHPRYQLIVKGTLICTYEADFEYFTPQGGVTEDVKGARTREYIIKRNLMFACLGIRVTEVDA